MCRWKYLNCPWTTPIFESRIKQRMAYTRVEEPFEKQVPDLEDSIIDETLELNTVKNSTWSKSKKYNIQLAIKSILF